MRVRGHLVALWGTKNAIVVHTELTGMRRRRRKSPVTRSLIEASPSISIIGRIIIIVRSCVFTAMLSVHSPSVAEGGSRYSAA